MSSRSHNLTNPGASIVVVAYGMSDVCVYARTDVRLTSRSLNASRAAVSMMCFLDSGELVGRTEGTRSNHSARSVLFSGGSIALVLLMVDAAPSISSRSRPKSSTACTSWPAILAPVHKRRTCYCRSLACALLVPAQLSVSAMTVHSKECGG
jgi:hypothetical protein